MSKSPEAAAPQAENAGVFNAAAPGAGSDQTAALAAARAEGAKGERERIRSIVNSEAAVGRKEQAFALALDTDIDAEGAIKVLNVSPQQAAASAIPSIAERAANAAEFGAHNAPQAGKGEVTDAIWSKVLKKYS